MLGLSSLIPTAYAASLGGLERTADNAGFINRNFWGIATGLTRWFFSFLAIIFLVLMIYGGVTWMTARGEGKKVETAQGAIQAAVIGLIIISAAYAITAFIGDFTLNF
jgi:hypothetical protein